MNNPSVQDLAISLKLSYVRDHADSLITRAKQTKMDYEDFLCELLQKEVQRRGENGIIKRLRAAKFPIKNIWRTLTRLNTHRNLEPNLKN